MLVVLLIIIFIVVFSSIMTHASVPPDQREVLGISDNMVNGDP